MAKKNVDTSNMIFVGRFNEEEIRAKKDKEKVNQMKDVMPFLKYVHSEFVYKGKNIVGLDVWLSETYV